jgi:serine protease Do
MILAHVSRAAGVRFLMAAAMAAAALGMVACEKEPRDAAARAAQKIDISPSYEVRYATERISPTVVQLDVVTEDFIRGQPRSSRAIGSGVIIDKEGHVLTNFHVAGRAKRIDLTLASQEHVRGKLIGADHWTDLALVQLDMDEVHRKGLTFQIAQLGNSSDITLGQPVMAVGTPYGLSRTITAGIISNTDRAFEETTMEGGYETGWFNNWIQMDAAINPGNSGGPLINMRGEVIGINTRGFSDANSLGFAIPIDTAKEVVAELRTHGKVERSYVGLQLQPMQDLEKFYDVPGNQGVLVASVEKDSPAMTAGVKAEDILLAVNGKPVNARFPEQLAAVRKLISDYPVGTKLEFTLRRSNGGIAARPTTAAAATSTSPASMPRTEPIKLAVTTDKLESVVAEEKAIAAWGLTVRDLTRAYLREARLPPTKGVLVTGARAGSPADRASIRSSDIIVQVSNPEKPGASIPITSAEDLEKFVATWEKNPQPVIVDVSRDRGRFPAVIKP